jgi:hypothetical protein
MEHQAQMTQQQQYQTQIKEIMEMITEMLYITCCNQKQHNLIVYSGISRSRKCWEEGCITKNKKNLCSSKFDFFFDFFFFFHVVNGAPYLSACGRAILSSTPIDKDWKACSPNRPTASQDSPYCGFNTVTPTAIAHNSNDVRCDRPRTLKTKSYISVDPFNLQKENGPALKCPATNSYL